MKFRKKPIVIEAVQFTGTGESCDEVTMFLGSGYTGETHQWDTRTTDGVTIKTLEGEMHVGPGDWIIKGIKGEFYPCRLDIFAASYEEAGAASVLRDVGVTDAMADPGCICAGNWRNIVNACAPLIGRRYLDHQGMECVFFGVVHDDDDYYYGMSSSTHGMCLLSCVMSIEGHGYAVVPINDETLTPVYEVTDAMIEAACAAFYPNDEWSRTKLRGDPDNQRERMRVTLKATLGAKVRGKK